MFNDDEPSVIRDGRALTEHFQPEELVCRDGQIAAIRDSLKPLLRGVPSRSVLLHGPPGSGKTCTARHVASAFAGARSTALAAYANCWMSPSAFGVLYALLQDMGKVFGVHRKGIPVDEALAQLAQHTKGRQCALILDEADQLEDENVLYTLLGMEHVALILITNKPEAFAGFDDRVRSRLLTAEAVAFPAYAHDEVLAILQQRARAGLVPGAVSRAQLDRIAELADGDARVAIGILRAAAEEAERKGRDKLKDAAIEAALAGVLQKEHEAKLAQLSQHQRLLVECLADPLPAAKLFDAYAAACKRAKLEPANERTVRKHLERLSRLGLVKAAGDVRWRVYEKA